MNPAKIVRAALAVALALLVHPNTLVGQTPTTSSAGKFIAGINYSAGAPVNPTNTGYLIGGLLPEQIVTGDLNGDGIPDIVMVAGCTTDYSPQCVNGWALAVFLGNGDGTFQAPKIAYSAAGSNSFLSLAVGDFNGDGNLDVVTFGNSTTSTNGVVNVFLGDGQGDLTLTQSYPVAGTTNPGTSTVVVGHFSENSALDFAVEGLCSAATTPCNNVNDTFVSTFLGNGDGTFGAPTTVDLGSFNSYGAIVAADFNSNNDSNTDLLVMNDPTGGGNTASYITILFGNGNGTFRTPVTTAVPIYAMQYVVAADFNSDGNIDLALGGNNQTYILFGNGNGTFQSPIQYPTGGYGIAVGDFNDDGKPDLAVVSNVPSGGYGVTILTNNGTGGFSSGPAIPLGGWATASLAVADFNGDGYPDVALSTLCSETPQIDNHCPDGTLSILLGNSQGTMQAALLPPQSGGYTAVLVDVNGDGIPDLISGVWSGGEAGITVALGLGGGAYGPPGPFIPSGISSYPKEILAGDLNHDGKIDIVVVANGVGILLGNGDGTFQAPSVYTTLTDPVDARLGDFAGNGNLGVAVVYQVAPSADYGAVGIFLGNGDGTLQNEVVTNTTEIVGYGLAVGDLNHDGKADVAVVGTTTPEPVGDVTAVTVLLSNGDGTLTVKPNPSGAVGTNLTYCESGNICPVLASYPAYGEGPIAAGAAVGASIAISDIDSDGNLDLVIANQCEQNDPSCSTGSMAYWLGRGDGTFGVFPFGPPALADANYSGITLADVNGDGKPDIVATTASGVAVFLNTTANSGNASFAPGIVYAAEVIPGLTIPIVTDLNADGAPDIAVETLSSLAILFNRGPISTATTTSLASSLNPSVFGQNVTLTATVTGTSGTPSGTVTFYDGGTSIGTSTLSGTQSTLSTSSLSAGAHSITASYSGDSSHLASTSSALSQIVNQATTALTISSGANPSIWNQVVIFTATLTPQFGGQASGTVTFSDGTTVLNSVAVSNNVVTLSENSLATGTHSITVSYSGDANFQAATSSVLVQVVNLATTTTGLASSMNPQLVGQSITFTATVAGQFGGAATGSVIFKSGATTLGTVALTGNQATINTSYASAGARSVTASYGGDANDMASASAVLSQSVVKDFSTTTTLTSSPNPSFVNQVVMFTANVTSSRGTPQDGEVITFSEGATTLGTAPLTGGMTSLAVSTLASGTHTIKASYPGDSLFKASTSTLSQVVGKYATSIALSSSLNPSVYGQSITFTATVTSTGPTIPTGNVVFSNGGTSIGTVALDATGTATLTKSNLAAGTLLITATYKGDTQSATSTAGTSQVVDQATTTTVLASSRNPSTVDQSVKLTATVTSATTTPIGTVTFTLGTAVLGTATLSGGKATLATTTLPSGADSITATYSGNSNISGSSGSLTQQVN